MLQRSLFQLYLPMAIKEHDAASQHQQSVQTSVNYNPIHLTGIKMGTIVQTPTAKKGQLAYKFFLNVIQQAHTTSSTVNYNQIYF